MEHDSGEQLRRLDGLTKRQVDCLRLVFAGLSSKQIAAKLGLSPGTVDNHLKAAAASLGASGRFDAARMLAEHETRKAHTTLDIQPAGLGEPLPLPQLDPGSQIAAAPTDHALHLQDRGALAPPDLTASVLETPQETEEQTGRAEWNRQLFRIASIALLIVLILLGAGRIIEEGGKVAGPVRCYFKPTTCGGAP